MKKRIISFVLSLAILTSLLPIASAADEAKTLAYNFGWQYANDGTTTAGVKVDALVGKGYTEIDKLTYTNSDKWAFAAHNHISSLACNKTLINIGMSKDEVENNSAFVALRFSATKGTYIPTLSHGLYKTSPIVDIYLVKEDVKVGGYTAADLEFKSAASNGDAASAVNKAYIKALGDEYKIASRIDLYKDSRTYEANLAELSSRTLEDGTYYLFIRPVGFSGSETTDTRNMVIYSLTLAPVKEPELESVDLNTENAYVLLDDADGMKLSVSGKMTGGTTADLSSAEITYTTSDEDIATVSDEGVITPVSCGDFIVTVTVNLGDIILSKSLNLAVSEEPIVPSFEIYFNDAVARETTVSVGTKSGYFTKYTHGINWSLNTEQTAANYFAGDSNSARIQGEAKDFLFLSRTGDFAVDFTTAADGYYDITLGVMRNTSCTVINFYVDGKYVGSFDAHSDTNETDTVKEALVRSVELKGGKHTLLIRNANGAVANRFIKGVKFTGRAALSEVEKVQVEVTRTNLAAGESGDYKVKLMLENGGEYYPPLISSDGAVEAEFAVTSSDESVISISGGSFKALKPGKAKLTTSGTVDGKNVLGETEITVNELTFEKVDLNLDEAARYFVGGEKKLAAKAILSDGSEVSERDITSITFESSNENIATVDDGVFKALGEGAVTITAKVTFNNKTVHVSKTVNVESVKLASIEAKTEDNVVFLLDDDGSRILVTGINNDGSTVDLTGNTFTYESLTPEIVSVDVDGYVHYVSRGTGKVKVSANIEGKAFECEAEVVSGSAKTKPTIYTQEMREKALENVKKYDWAKSLQKSAIARADKWVENLDKLYELMPGEGVPRSYTISTYNAPVNATETTPAMQYNCPWCGVDIRTTTGSYSWGVDPLTRPWKIQCTSCKRLFPSNDFGSFYELGLNKANGTFSRETALARHRELFGDLSIEESGEFGSEQWKAYYGYGNKEGYLYNELYTEKDSTWMVDDGFGWSPRDGVPGSSESVSTNPKWAPIAFYTHRVWRLTGDDTYQKILDDLREAYLYTGDAKYGRAGAILTDRVADLYPEFNIQKVSLSYSHSHGFVYTGKVIGCIWENFLVQSLVKAYDAFYPMMDDPQVISYLSKKSAEYGMKNPKTSGELILENAENGIVREVLDAVYTARIGGNFGSHQYSAALAAVALDTYPESGDMFEWLCKPSTYKSASVKDPVYLSTSRTAYTECTGGELLSKYIKDVCRDGFGNEVAAGYNSGWVSNTIEIASLLARYEKDTPISLMKNLKYVKMFDSIIKETVGNGYTLQIGDSGGTASKGIHNPAPETLLAFSLLDEEDKNRIWIAQNYYYSVGGDLDDIYVDIFTDNSTLAGEIQDIIDEHGELMLESENLTGFGLAVL
ncbi:MAG: hypothetical protein IJF32_13085, partial [Oscillospiraceae bacterium]|nr:hypothetical protein [Oscillospiraceae bacterium]